MWWTKEDGNLSDLEATVVVRKATRVIWGKHGSQIFRDLGGMGSRPQRNLLGSPGRLEFEGGGLTICVRCQLNHFGGQH